MNTRRISAALILGAALVLAPSARAAYDAFLKLGDIKGESTDAQHRDWIEIESYQFSEVQSSVGSATGGAGAGKVRFSPFQIRKLVDRASPKLNEAAGSGRHFQDATVEVRKAGGGPQEFLVIKLKDCYITGYQMSGGGTAPTESFVLNYAKMEIEYKPQQTGHANPANVKVAPNALSAVALQPTSAPPKITGVSASVPTFGTHVTLTVASTGACANARVDWGDGSVNQFYKLTGTSTPLPVHTYASPGVKTIRVGGPDASYWSSGVQKKQELARQGDCTGEAQAQVTLRLAVAPAPVVR
jgi:type VI secretion system secreted protein Hcp